MNKLILKGYTSSNEILVFRKEDRTYHVQVMQDSIYSDEAGDVTFSVVSGVDELFEKILNPILHKFILTDLHKGLSYQFRKKLNRVINVAEDYDHYLNINDNFNIVHRELGKVSPARSWANQLEDSNWIDGKFFFFTDAEVEDLKEQELEDAKPMSFFMEYMNSLPRK